MQKSGQSQSFVGEGRRCDFCGRHAAEVKLVEGPDVYICEVCVDICGEIVRDESGALNSLSPRAEPAAENAGAVDQAVLWRRLDRPGHEFARLSWLNSRWVLAGSAVFVHERQPCRLDYLVVCNGEWQTVSGRVSGWVGNSSVEVVLASEAGRRWWLNGKECAEVAGCLDLDLNFSPSTNLLPIRRLDLPIGSEALVKAAWLRFPGFNLEPLEQLYRRTAPSTYRYESAGGRFVTELEVGKAGFVTQYPNFWETETI